MSKKLKGVDHSPNLRDERIEMQTQLEKGVLIGQVRAKMLNTTIKELTPQGAKLEITGTGQFVGAQFSARHLETTNIFQKMDGTFEWETKAIDTTPEGETVVSSSRGTGMATGPSTISGVGEGIIMTQSPKLSWLNRVKTRVEGNGDLATGDYEEKVFSA